MFSKCLNILNIVLTSYIANQWKSRQIKSPLIGKFAKCAKTDPLRWKTIELYNGLSIYVKFLYLSLFKRKLSYKFYMWSKWQYSSEKTQRKICKIWFAILGAMICFVMAFWEVSQFMAYILVPMLADDFPSQKVNTIDDLMWLDWILGIWSCCFYKFFCLNI